MAATAESLQAQWRQSGRPPASMRALRRGNILLAATILAIGVVLIAGMWLAAVAYIRSERSMALSHAEVDLTNLSAAFKDELCETLKSTTDAMAVVAQKMRAAPPGDYDVFHWTKEIPLLTSAATQISIVGPDGKLLATTREEHPQPLDLSDREHVRIYLDGHFKGVFVSKPLVGRVTDRALIKVTRRVDAADGTFLGIIVLSLAPERLTRLHDQVDFGESGRMTLFGATDRIIRAQFSTHKVEMEATGKKIPPVPLPTSPGQAITSINHSIVDNTTRLFSRREVSGYDLVVSVSQDVDEILAIPHEHAAEITCVGVVVSVLLGVLLLLLVLEIRESGDREIALRANERKLRDYAELSSDWFWEQDADLCFTSAGSRAPLFAHGTDVHQRLKRWELPGVSNGPAVWDEHRAACGRREAFRDFRYTMHDHDGRLAHVSTSGVPVFDEDGAFTGFRGTGREITAEVQAENALREAKARAEQAETLLRDAVESMSEGFVIYDSEDRFVMCNDAYRRIYPASAPLMVPGIKFVDLVVNSLANGHYPEAAGHEQEWLAVFRRQHEEAAGEVEHRLSNGKWILVSQRRMHNGGVAGLRIDITALKQAQLALRESEARLDRAQEIAGIGSWELDCATGEYQWSREMYRMRGVTPENFRPVRGRLGAMVHTDDRPVAIRWLDDLQKGIPRGAVELRVLRSDGERIVRAECRPVVDEDGRIHKLIGTMQDITELRLTEQKLLHAQKMETIGQLTGGMAHDFNNMLGVIIGNLDLLGRLIKDEPLAEELRGEAQEAALRGADLTRRMLAFARRQSLRPQSTEVNGLVDGLARLIQRIVGDHIVLKLSLDAKTWPAVVDPAQLEAALTNLAANARDAMPNGGDLEIATRNARLELAYTSQHAEVTPGDYVLVEVSDTGTGIPREVIDRIFEPFFTTKETGRGSGLGLSMVFGFIRQSGGHVTVHSEPDLGTTFRLYLPRSSEAAIPPPERSAHLPVGNGNELILLAEDNAELRRATARALQALGYQVLEADSAKAALDLLRDRDDVDLLFTDIVMPGDIDGLELTSRATALRPDIRILLTSGFPDMRGAGERIARTDYRLLTKPYRHDELARSLREVLDADATVLVEV